MDAIKKPILKKAAARLLSEERFQPLRDAMATWRKEHAWIEDSALFEVARNLPGLDDKAWWDWPEGLRFRNPNTLKEFRWGWQEWGTCARWGGRSGEQMGVVGAGNRWEWQERGTGGSGRSGEPV